MKNKLTIIKVGGFIFEDEYILESFLSNFSKISGNKILVHGGGKIASNFSKKLGIAPDQPGKGKNCSISFWDEVTILKFSSKTIALVDVVPWSIART